MPVTAPLRARPAGRLGSTRLVAAAATGLAPLLDGADRSGVVIGVLSQAVIIQISGVRDPRVICLLSAAASGVPNGVRLGGIRSMDGHRPDDEAVVGGGRIRIVGWELAIVRRWSSAVRPIDPPTGTTELAEAAAAARRGVTASQLAALTEALEHCVDSTTEDVARSAIDALVGLGPGLTPAGDDVVAGMLTGLHATGHAGLAGRLGRVERLDERTTALSADLIRLAAAGHAGVEVLHLLAAVHTRAPLRRPIERLLSVGHTSGADLATGLAIGMRVGATRREVR